MKQGRIRDVAILVVSLVGITVLVVIGAMTERQVSEAVEKYFLSGLPSLPSPREWWPTKFAEAEQRRVAQERKIRQDIEAERKRRETYEQLSEEFGRSGGPTNVWPLTVNSVQTMQIEPTP